MASTPTDVKPTTDGSRTATAERLCAEELRNLDAYWRACNYLAAGMIYLQANPLLREPLMPEHVKLRLLGHWGSSPGLSFAYVHLNRLITKHDLDAIFLAGPGHGAPGVLAPIYLEGTYAEIYPNKGEDEEGMRAFFKEFSFPGGIGSHCTPETPGSIHEGGELGYSVSHAFGAVFDNPDLLVAVMVGDGESETGALATSWHVNKSLNPIRDGAVLPILHLNGHKINNSTLLARISHDELECLFRGYGLDPAFCGRARSSGHAPADGRHPGGLCAGDPPSPAGGAYQRHAYPPALADDRPAQPQGLDRPQGRGWPQGGRVLACPSGAARWPARQPGPSAAARGLATQLQARGVVRRHRAVASGTEGARPQGARGA